MLRLLRARACCLITALLLAAGTMGAALGELLHDGAAHDVACVSVGDVPHDASSHRYRADTGPGGHHEHCVGCHLARAPRIGTHSVGVTGHADEGAALRPLAAIGSARSAALDSLPPRSPPRHS